MHFSRGLIPLLLLTAVASLSLTFTGASVSAVPAVHQLVVTGVGTTTYPAFDAGTSRYGVRTTAGTGGAVTVTASTDDPAGKVFVDGALATGPVQVTGLAEGEEISVIFEDPGAPAQHHSVIYLPVGFPVLEATASSATQPGSTLMTLNPFGGNPDRWLVALDGNGVPDIVQRYSGNMHDLKQLSNGNYSVSDDVPLPAGNEILELNKKFEEVGRRHTAAPLVNTDFHESLFLPNGNRVLIAYELDSATSQYDAVVQEINPAGTAVFTWDSGDPGNIDLSTERVNPSTDYAHLNSVQVMSDHDFLISLRHLSVVLKIARTARPGVAEGDIVWRLGGRLSDFDLTGDPMSGPCAQHTASETPEGHIMIFDNGSGFGNRLCVDPADPAGPAVERPRSRVVEYALDESDPDNMVATIVNEYAPPGRFMSFAGSAERMANGNTLIGWTNHPDEVATELGPDFQPIWHLSASNGFGSYRVHRAVVPDAFDPTATLKVPADGAAYAYGAAVIADYGCTDRGGSNLVECSAPADEGSAINTSTPGAHTFTVTARDGDGNVVTTSRSYTVRPAPVVPPTPTPPPPTTAPTPVVDHRVDLSVRNDARTRLTAASAREKAVVVLRNDGNVADRFTLGGPRSSKAIAVRYRLGGDDVTRAVRRGTFTTSTLEPGARLVLKIVLTRRIDADLSRTLRVKARSVGDTGRSDAVSIRVRVR